MILPGKEETNKVASQEGAGTAPLVVSRVELPAQDGQARQAAVVTINRPAMRNCVSLAMWKELGATFRRLGEDPEVRAILLTGAGGNFSAGADISEFAKVRANAEQAEEYEIAVDACCDDIANAPKPTIAVVEGYAMGGGAHLAMSCDFRFAAHSARFGIPAARLSIVYGLHGTQRLFNLVGLTQAKRILYSAATFDAARALQIGFIDEASDDPMKNALEFAGGMAANAPLSIAGAKFLLNGMAMGTGTLADVDVNAVIDRAVESEDYRDARQAFLEKRPPVFRGR